MGRRVIALLLIFLGGSAAARADDWTAPRAITSIDFNEEILSALGVHVEAVRESVSRASSPEFPGDAFETRSPSLLEFSAPGGDFERFSRGSLFHAGGFELRLPGGVPVSLEGFELRVAPPPDDFDWLDASGRRLFVLRHMQFTSSLAAEELRLINVSIHLAPELAARLGRPDLADLYVGVANIRLPARLRELVQSALGDDPGGGGAGPLCEVRDGVVDVALTGLDSPSQLAREAGVRVALAFSATLFNTGTASVDWYEPIAPTRFDGVGPHPFLSLAMYRLDEDGLVQLGLGDVKHAFRALNLGCDCSSDSSLYPGCGDVYGVSTNENRRYLAPREEITASTGGWQRVGSHFDRCLGLGSLPCDPATDDADDYRDHDGEGALYHDAFEHRLVVPEAGLLSASGSGAASTGEEVRFFVEAWYLVAGDVDLWNSLGRREVDPHLVGGVWSFELEGPLENGSVLDEISDAQRSIVDTGAGRLQLAAATRDLGNGFHHYAYTLMNFDFDRRIEAFRVPLEPGVVVARVDSRALADDPLGDWTATIDDAAVTWQAPSGESLDWGMLVSFGLDADRSPRAGAVWLDVLEPGLPAGIAVATVTPVPEPKGALLAPAALAAIAWVRRYGSTAGWEERS